MTSARKRKNNIQNNRQLLKSYQIALFTLFFKVRDLQRQLVVWQKTARKYEEKLNRTIGSNYHVKFNPVSIKKLKKKRWI